MKTLLEYIAAHSAWLTPFVPFLAVAVWFAIANRWESYSRKKNYEELTILSALRDKSIITQEEFDEKKEELLSA